MKRGPTSSFRREKDRPRLCYEGPRASPGGLAHTLCRTVLPELRLKLFIAGDSPRAREAAANLARVCDEFLAEACVVETIDILVHPEAADEYRILTTPTVVRDLPLPRRRATGDFRDATQLLAALALYPTRTPT